MLLKISLWGREPVSKRLGRRLSQFTLIAWEADISEVHSNVHQDLLLHKGTELYIQRACSHVAPD